LIPGPDVFPPVTSLGEIEARMGLPSLESLLHERDTLVKQVADLRARHGPFGTYQDLRKIELARVAATVRARATVAGIKMTEAQIDEAAHADGAYIDFVTIATKQKTEWVILENRIQGIQDTILRANAIARYLSAELHL
jgi:hypothetical protein